MPSKTKPVKAPRARRESNEEFLASRMRFEEAALLAEIEETDGSEVLRGAWPIAERLASRGLITFGAARGPGGDWRRAEVVKKRTYRARARKD